MGTDPGDVGVCLGLCPRPWLQPSGHFAVPSVAALLSPLALGQRLLFSARLLGAKRSGQQG